MTTKFESVLASYVGETVEDLLQEENLEMLVFAAKTNPLKRILYFYRKGLLAGFLALSGYSPSRPEYGGASEGFNKAQDKKSFVLSLVLGESTSSKGESFIQAKMAGGSFDTMKADALLAISL